MHLWHGNAGAEQLNVTVRLEFPIRIQRRSVNTPTEVKRRDENLLGAIWIPHDKSTFLMMNIRGKDNWEIPSRSYTASSDIIGYVYRKIIMPWWRAYFRPNTTLGELEPPLHLWWAYTLPQWSCLINEWPKGLPKKSSKGSPAELNCYKIAQVDGEVLLMKRRRTLGVAYTNGGLKSTLEASVEKLVSRLEKRGSSSNSWATYSV